MNHGFYTLMVSTGSELSVCVCVCVCVCAFVYACACTCVHSGAGAEAVSVSERMGSFPSFCCSHYFNAPFLNFCHLLPNPTPLSISRTGEQSYVNSKEKAEQHLSPSHFKIFKQSLYPVTHVGIKNLAMMTINEDVHQRKHDKQLIFPSLEKSVIARSV